MCGEAGECEWGGGVRVGVKEKEEVSRWTMMACDKLI